MININQYHDRRDIKFFSTEGGPYNSGRPGVIYLGTEVETDREDGTGWNSDALERKLKTAGFLPFFHPTRDGSLTNGCEFVSYPATLQAWMELSDMIRDGFRALIDAGLRSHETKTCGLHVHASKVTTEAQEKMLLLMLENNWPAITAFARRVENNYAARQWSSDRDGKLPKDSRECIKGDDWSPNTDDRYCALNLRPSNTVEFRIFKGTLNPDTFFATLQLVDNLMRLARVITLDDAERITIMDIVGFRRYRELDSYAISRKLWVNKNVAYVNRGEEE